MNNISILGCFFLVLGSVSIIISTRYGPEKTDPEKDALREHMKGEVDRRYEHGDEMHHAGYISGVIAYHFLRMELHATNSKQPISMIDVLLDRYKKDKHTRTLNPILFPKEADNTYTLFNPEMTGFSVLPIGQMCYKIKDGVCYIHYFVTNHGTSNSTKLTFKAPFKSKFDWAQPVITINNGVRETGRVSFKEGSDIVEVFPDLAASKPWVASNGKAFYSLGDGISYTIQNETK